MTRITETRPTPGAQTTLIATARKLGMTIRPADSNGAMLAEKNGASVTLPPVVSAKLEHELASQLDAIVFPPHPPFRPGRGAPGSDQLEHLLEQCRRSGSAYGLAESYPGEDAGPDAPRLVGVGRRSGPRLPQVRPASAGAPDMTDLDCDMEAVAKQRWFFAQSFYSLLGAITIENRDEARQRREAWKPATERGKPAEKWGPKRHDAMCMWAAHSRRVLGRTKTEVAAMLAEPDPPATKAWRTARDCIDVGDSVWAALGAWPWGAFSEKLPAEWWTQEAAWLSLAAWGSPSVTRSLQSPTSVR
jgi:hypothetical protein